jgi:anti-anti-sigma factor
LEIQEQRHGAVTVLKPMGPILQGETVMLRQRLNETISRSMGRIVIDATLVAYVDSPGLELLVQTTDQMANSGRSLRLAGATETLREVLELTGVGDRFEHYADVNTAVRSYL